VTLSPRAWLYLLLLVVAIWVSVLGLALLLR